MAVNQPMISDNQVDNSWKLEVTNQINNEETRVNALLSRIVALETQMFTARTDVLDTYSITKEVTLEVGVPRVTSLRYPLLEDSRLISWGIYLSGRPTVAPGQNGLIRCSYVDDTGIQDFTTSNINFTTSTPLAGTTITRNINRDYNIPEAIGTHVDYENIDNIASLRMSVAFLLQRI